MSASFLGAAGARTRDAAPGGAAAASLPTDRGDAGRSTFAGKLAVGHQEIGRIVDELDQIYNSQPTEWLPMKHIGHMIANMWYEDIDEFEDAMGGTFSEFMHSMPHIEIRKNSLGSDEFKVVMPDPDAPPSVMTLRVENREDLWRVLFKSPDAKVTISHLEFEIGADSKRVIDTLYNHISHAVWNLSSHLRGNGSQIPSEQVELIAATIDELNQARRATTAPSPAPPPRRHLHCHLRLQLNLRPPPRITAHHRAPPLATGLTASHEPVRRVPGLAWQNRARFARRMPRALLCVARVTVLPAWLWQLLDVEEPFDLVVHDPTGASLFKPDHGVKVRQ